MSFDTTGLQAYTEEQPNELLTKLQVEGGLASVVAMQTGIKGTQNLHILDSTVTFGDDDCNPVYTDSAILTNRKITVGKIAVNNKLCAKDLQSFYTQQMMKKGNSGDEEIPLAIETAWLELQANKIQNALAKSDFQGDTASLNVNLNKYDGLLKILDGAGGAVIDGNTAGVTAVTVANILDVLEAVYMARTDEMSEKTDLSLWIPKHFHDLYVSALKNANLFHYKADDNTSKLYGTDVTLRPTVGLSGVAEMVLASDENIIIGVDGDLDDEDIKVIFDPINDLTLYKAKFKRGVQVAFPDQIVRYKNV